jgi:hypothetical protein
MATTVDQFSRAIVAKEVVDITQEMWQRAFLL